MLTAKEEAGLLSILNKLNTKDLLALASTTTNGMVISETRHEAMQAVVMYTDTALSFLERKKITKPVLLQYLKDENVMIPLTGIKPDLIRACLTHWQADNEKSYTPIYYNEPVKEEMCQPEKLPASQEQPDSNSLLHEMGMKFTSWYFPMLNNLDGFGVQHFWPDCMLKVCVKRGSDLELGNPVSGANEVVGYLSNLINREKLLFDPNLSVGNGVDCSYDSHGLIKIITKGVVHKPPLCVGLFDESFGLVRDPSSCDTWKIKYTELLMHLKDGSVSRFGQNISEEYMLCDS